MGTRIIFLSPITLYFSHHRKPNTGIANKETKSAKTEAKKTLRKVWPLNKEILYNTVCNDQN